MLAERIEYFRLIRSFHLELISSCLWHAEMGSLDSWHAQEPARLLSLLMLQISKDGFTAQVKAAPAAGFLAQAEGSMGMIANE